MNGIRHRGCGGEIRADWSLQHVNEDYSVPAHRCAKCGKEVLNDLEVVLNGDVQDELLFRVRYSQTRREWLAVVFCERGNVRVVHTVGCEDTREAATSWALGTIALMQQYGEGASLPDKYDREATS